MILKRHKKEKDLTNIMNTIYNKDRKERIVLLLAGIILAAVSYNVFLLPNNIVYGVGGIGVILKKFFNFDPAIVILVSNAILLVLSYFTLGKKKTLRTLGGSILFPLFVKMSEWLPEIIDFGSLEPIVLIVVGAVIHGAGLGLIFKSGYTTGGTDILNDIVSKYGKTSMGKAMIMTDGLIALLSLIAFDVPTCIYSIICLFLISAITDKVIIGVSQSKTFYVITDHETAVKKFLLDNLSHGVTVLSARGGYTGNNEKVLMCTIPTREYFVVKEGLKEIDPEAFFLVIDAYEVKGGA